jgi:methylglyoxal synthase
MSAIPMSGVSTTAPLPGPSSGAKSTKHRVYVPRPSHPLGQLCVALVSHDGMKDVMIAFAARHRDFFAQCRRLVATGTTGGLISKVTGLKVDRMLSGPWGGDLQIGAQLAVGEIHVLIFFRDPMTAQPHEPDINALVRACDVHNVACATSPDGAELLVAGLKVRAAAGVEAKL